MSTRLHVPAPLADLLDQVTRAARPTPLFVVGGIVRDLCLGRALPSKLDLDLVVEGDAPALAEQLSQKLGAQLVVHPRFGTSTLTLPDGREIDLAGARTERYPHPGSLPVVSPGSLAQDLWRRDFSVNALAARVEGGELGQLLDPTGGLPDLASSRLRVLHPGSWRDDPTRMFRAARFEQRLGFQLDPTSLSLLQEALGAASLETLSPQRVSNELKLCFQEQASVNTLLRLQELGVLPALGFPLRMSLRRQQFWRRLQGQTDPGWLEGLSFELARESRALLMARWHRWEGGPEWAPLLARLDKAQRDSEVYALLQPLSPTQLDVLGARVAGRARLTDRLSLYREQLATVKPMLNGRHLSARGLRPGPAFKDLLQNAFSAQLDENWTEVQQAEAWLDR